MHRNALAALVALFTLVAAQSAAAVTIDWVSVGGAGNAADTTGYGAVADTYRISETEVTSAQYAEFLNAVADTDTYALYNTNMGNTGPGYFGGITRSGSSGSYTYGAIAGREDMPVNYMSFYDSLRFANWLHNGQLSGPQDSTTTEDGAYTIIAESYPDGPFITRNADATIFLTSEDEWYKAAYYDALSTSYFDYPTGSDTPPTCATPGTTPNTANCNRVVDDLTVVGSYTGSASASGTFNQGGNVWEWNEAISDSMRGERGGDFFKIAQYSHANSRSFGGATTHYTTGGFRVASIPGGWFPEPVPTLSQWGRIAFVMLLFTATAWALRRRRAA
jgi:sulfatase modifying factor 1